MGKSETVSASIGIKILVSDLILQINKTNFNLIKKMIYSGSIEDSNSYYNEVYRNIIGYDETDNELPENYLEFKEFLINKLKTNGSYYFLLHISEVATLLTKINFVNFTSTHTSKVEPNLTNGCLFERY